MLGTTSESETLERRGVEALEFTFDGEGDGEVVTHKDRLRGLHGDSLSAQRSVKEE